MTNTSVIEKNPPIQYNLKPTAHSKAIDRRDNRLLPRAPTYAHEPRTRMLLHLPRNGLARLVGFAQLALLNEVLAGAKGLGTRARHYGAA